jgi:uncharacterized membrane protein YkvA (DUF1232 family)
MNIANLNKMFDAFGRTAEKLIKNKSKTQVKVQLALQKAVKNRGALSTIWTQLLLLVALAKDYANGSYTNLPKSSIVAIVAGLLYFISPIDLIPDFLVGIGFIDDAFILGLVYKQVAKDLEKYQAWKNQQKLTIHI